MLYKLLQGCCATIHWTACYKDRCSSRWTKNNGLPKQKVPKTVSKCGKYTRFSMPHRGRSDSLGKLDEIVSLYQHIHSINLGSNPIDHLTLRRIALRYITALCSFKCLYLKHNSVWTLIMQTYVIPLIVVWLRSNGELLKETCLYFIIRINILIACYISYTIEPFKSTILKS